ncbi:MAG: hypothetical protein ACK5MB_07885, partial [Phycisphaerales bacterium]
RREPVHIAVVDLTIPLDESDGESSLEDGGTRILELLSRLDQPPPTPDPPRRTLRTAAPRADSGDHPDATARA